MSERRQASDEVHPRSDDADLVEAPSDARPGVKERILRAALHLLRESGVKRLAQPQVAKAAGVPQGHLTYYFPRRTDLLLAIGQRSLEVVWREIDQFLQGTSWPGMSAGQRSRALALASFLVKDRARVRMMLGIAVEAHDDPALRDALQAQVDRVRAVIAMGLGKDADDPDVEIALATLHGLGLRHLLRKEDHGSGASTEDLIERLADWLAMPPPPRGRR